jgi:hypothetical protein
LERRLKEKDDLITILMVNKNECEKKNKETNEKMQIIDQKLTKHEKHIDDNKRKVDLIMSDRTLMDKVKDIEVMIKNVPPVTSSVGGSGGSYADVLKKTEAKIVAAVKVDLNQAAKKEKRLIVFNLPICPNEDDQINKILDKINFDKSKKTKIFRLKQKNDKIPPLIIELIDTNAKHELAKKSKLLKTIEELKNVYFNFDLTNGERDILKQLIIERNELNQKEKTQENTTDYYYGIRNNKVVKIIKNKI